MAKVAAVTGPASFQPVKWAQDVGAFVFGDAGAIITDGKNRLPASRSSVTVIRPPGET